MLHGTAIRSWSWETAGAEVPSAFKNLITDYLKAVFSSEAEHKGRRFRRRPWLTWIARLFPDTKVHSLGSRPA